MEDIQPFADITNSFRDSKPTPFFTNYLHMLIQWEKCTIMMANSIFGYRDSEGKRQFLNDCSYAKYPEEVSTENMIGSEI